MPAEVARRPFTVDEYYRMAESGILREDDRVELIEGEIVQMSPIGSRHAACVARCSELMTTAGSVKYLTWTQNPVRIGSLTEPVPDIALLRRRSDFYTGRHPTPEEVLLIIEVMETSAVYDRNVKLPLYARAGIPEVWLIDVNEALIEAHRNPEGGRYSSKSVFRPGERISTVRIEGLEVAVEDLLPGG